MIWPREALLLAGTKLRTRKIRLTVTVVVTALLFGVLAFLASVTQGTVDSLKSFSSEGYGNKFYIQATPLTYQSSPKSDQELKDVFAAKQKELVARKKAEAKKLGVAYDESHDQLLPLQTVQTGPNTTDMYPNYQSPLIVDYFRKKNESVAGTDLASFQKLAKNAGAVGTYSGVQNNFMSGPFAAGGQFSVMVGGKENLSQYENNDHGQPQMSQSMTGVASISTLGWRNMDNELLQPFVLPGQNLATGKDGSVPVVAPYSAAEEILGLKSLPQTATAQQKLERLVTVRQGVAGKGAQICYRNAASAELLGSAFQQQQEIEANKKNKEYTAPSLQYKLPTEPCGAVTIKSDKRTAEEKKADDNQKKFDAEFGQAKDPQQGVVNIRIVGLTPDVDTSYNISMSSMLASMLTSSVGAAWVSPAKVVSANKFAADIQGGTAATANRDQAVYYAQFPTRKSMEDFIKSQDCTAMEQIPGPGGQMAAYDATGTSVEGCIKQKKVFTVMPYGNSAGAIEEFKTQIWQVAKYAILVIVIIAALIMMGNIGKIIADSRRETAVFRSLGATRLDIAQIYLTYTVLICLLVAVVSVVLGSVAAAILSHRYSPDLSIAAVLAYNSQDVHKVFSFFGFNPLYILAICGLVVLSGLLSALLPLLTNMRRNPIRDMRDES